MKTMKINAEHGIISRRPYGAFGYHGWPTLTKLTDGTLVVGVSGHRVWHVCPFGKTHLHFSRDNGKTWSAPLVPNDTWLDDRDVGLAAMPNNGLAMTWFNADYTLLDVRAEKLKEVYSPAELDMINAYRTAAIQTETQKPGSYIRFSNDGGMTWDDPKPAPVSAPHCVCVLQDGSILYLGRENSIEIPFEQREVVAMKSIDKGQTWERIGQPVLPPYARWDNMVEPHAIQLPSGRIVGAIRYQSRNRDDEYKAYGTFSMFCIISDDGGYTWSDPKWMGVSGAPPHLMWHSSGALLCSYGRRAKGDESIRVAVSYDQGETWTQDICLNDQSPDGDLGYASTVELADGSLLTTYYQKYVDENGVADKKTSLLYTKWKLPEKE